MSYINHIIPLLSRASLDGAAVVYTSTCPFCKWSYAAKDKGILKSLTTLHIQQHHRKEVLDSLRQSDDYKDEIINRCADLIPSITTGVMPADLWDEMPEISNLSVMPVDLWDELSNPPKD
jgi:hypothetical protein